MLKVLARLLIPSLAFNVFFVVASGSQSSITIGATASRNETLRHGHGDTPRKSWGSEGVRSINTNNVSTQLTN